MLNINFMQKHCDFLVEVSTLLELALWKMLMNEASQQRNRRKTDVREVQMGMRLSGGRMFQVVIPGVLSFL
jgi:hypothetical protein